MKILLYIVLCYSLFVSANKDVVIDKIEISRSAKDFKIPTKLWDLLLNPESRSDNSLNKEIPIVVWLPMSVKLSAPVEGILNNLNSEISFSMGGGEIDLNHFVKGQKGSFYIKFLLEEFQDLSDFKVYFYSRSLKRKIDGDVFGSGCNVFFDVTKKFISINTKEGIKVNITDNRHLSVIGGRFILARKNQGKIYLSQVSFFDSTKTEYFCQE